MDVVFYFCGGMTDKEIMDKLRISDPKTLSARKTKGSLGVAVIPARCGGVKSDKIGGKNEKEHGKSTGNDTTWHS